MFKMDYRKLVFTQFQLMFKPKIVEQRMKGLLSHILMYSGFQNIITEHDLQTLCCKIQTIQRYFKVVLSAGTSISETAGSIIGCNLGMLVNSMSGIPTTVNGIN